MAITEDTIIIQREGWENGTPDLDYKSIVSLDHSGQQIWEFKPAGFLDHFIIGNDNRIYVTVSTGSGESIHVFDE